LNKVLNFDFESKFNFKAVLNFSGKKDVILEAENSLLDQKDSFSKNEYKFVLRINGAIEEFDATQYPDLINSLEKEKFTCFSTLITHGIPDPYDIVDKPFSLTIDDKGRGFNLIDYAFKLEHPYFIKSLLMSFINYDSQINNLHNITNTSIEEIRLRLQKSIFDKLNIIKPFLKRLSPIEDLRFSDNFNIFESKASQEFTISNLFIEFKVNGDWHPFSNLSDGTRRLFFIISEVAFPDSFFFTEGRIGKFKYDNPRIILIEEPELGIHPNQLHTLILFLKEQSHTNQIIITTHSPQILDVLNENELNSIILSYYKAKGGTFLRHLSIEEIKKAREYIREDFLSDYWVHSDLETTK